MTDDLGRWRDGSELPDRVRPQTPVPPDQRLSVGDRVRLRIDELNALPTARLLDALNGPSGDDRDVMLADLATAVSPSDPEVAIDAASFISDDGLRDGVCSFIGKQTAAEHPELARAAVDAIADRGTKDQAYAAIAEKMAREHPREAFATAAQISRPVPGATGTPKASLRDVTFGVIAEEMVDGPYPRRAAGAIAVISDDGLRDEMRTRIAPKLASADEVQLANTVVRDISDRDVRAGARAAVDEAIADRGR